MARLRSASGAAKAAGQAGSSAADLGKRAVGATATGAARIAERSAAALRLRLGEDPEAILQGSPLVAGVLSQRSIFETDPESFQNLYNLRVRPVVGAMLLTGAGGGLASYDEVLSRLTRTIFDGTDLVGGAMAGAMQSFVGGERFDAVNRFIDVVPGAEHAGGFNHRILHGHDLSSIVDVWSEHGTAGAMQAAYHIYGRDLFTPHGIPILPAGSAEAHAFLAANFGVGSAQAADLISINFVELLAGVVSVVGILRLWRLVAQLRQDAAVRRLMKESQAAVERDDPFVARELVVRALAKRPADPSLFFLKGWTYHRTDNLIEAHDAYVDAIRVLSEKDAIVDLGGAGISFRGLSATAALATSAALTRDEVHRPAWLDRVAHVARAGISGFQQAAARLEDRRFVRRIGTRSILPARSFSAALNHYLGGRLAGSALILPDRDELMKRAESHACENLDAVLVADGTRGGTENLAFVRSFISAELGALAVGP